MMYEGPSPQQRVGSGEDTMLAFALLGGIAVVGGWFLWYKYHPQIATWVIAAQHWQMLLIAHVTNRYEVLDRQALALDPSTVTAKTLYRLCHLVGLFYRVPAGVVTGALAVLCLMGNAPSRFTNVLTLDSLMKVQAKVFRTTAAFVGRDLRPVAIAQGKPRPLDAALHSKEWVSRYARKPDGSYDEDAALRELTRQLGPVWRRVLNAPEVVRCLLAAFALHAARERDAALAFLGDFSEAMAPQQNEGPAGASFCRGAIASEKSPRNANAASRSRAACNAKAASKQRTISGAFGTPRHTGPSCRVSSRRAASSS